MINMKKIISIIAFTLIGITINAQEQVISQKELPAAAKSFLQKYFPNGKVDYVLLEKNHLSSDEYKTKLSNGVEIEFNQKGVWKDIDGHHNEIPAKLIPKNIYTYAKSKFPNAKIVKIEKSSFGNYDIKLSNGLELEFDSKGNFKRIDD